MSTTYIREPCGDSRSTQVYGGADNITLQETERVIASLEGGYQARLFCSGMSAAMAIVNGFEKPIHVIAPDAMYYGLRRWLQSGVHPHRVSFVDMADPAALRAALSGGDTDLVWIETPSNPLWTVTDIAAVCRIARAAGAVVCVDSTIATPVLTQPLALGAHFVMHSATKYLNGHSDVTAGVLVAADDSRLWRQIDCMRTQSGATPGPFESWLLMRSLRTLDVRVRAQSTTAARLAAALVTHPAVHQVLYPGLATHKNHLVASRQMRGGFGAMLSIRLAEGADAALDAIKRVKIWQRATSLGGVESLIEHRASMEGENCSCPDDLLRLSVGLEDYEDLHRDIAYALDATRAPLAAKQARSGATRLLSGGDLWLG